MTYQYKCEHCEKEIEITKSIYSSSRIESCQVCNSELKRIYTSSGIKTGDGFKN